MNTMVVKEGNVCIDLGVSENHATVSNISMYVTYANM